MAHRTSSLPSAGGRSTSSETTDLLEELAWRRALDDVVDRLIDNHFVFGEFYMRRNDAQKFVAEKLGVELNSRVRAAVNDRMTERGCASVYWKGFKVFRGVNLKGLQPWRTKKPHRHLRAV